MLVYVRTTTVTTAVHVAHKCVAEFLACLHPPLNAQPITDKSLTRITVAHDEHIWLGVWPILDLTRLPSCSWLMLVGGSSVHWSTHRLYTHAHGLYHSVPCMCSVFYWTSNMWLLVKENTETYSLKYTHTQTVFQVHCRWCELKTWYNDITQNRFNPTNLS